MDELELLVEWFLTAIMCKVWDSWVFLRDLVLMICSRANKHSEGLSNQIAWKCLPTVAAIGNAGVSWSQLTGKLGQYKVSLSLTQTHTYTHIRVLCVSWGRGLQIHFASMSYRWSRSEITASMSACVTSSHSTCTYTHRTYRTKISAPRLPQ